MDTGSLKSYVAQFNDTEGFGGAENIMLMHAKNLNELGINNLVILVKVNPSFQQRLDQAGIEWVHLPQEVTKYHSIKKIVQFGIAFADWLADSKYIISALHSHCFSASLFGAATSYFYNKKYGTLVHVATQHDSYTVERRPLRAGLLRLAEMSGTKIVAVSRHMTDSIKSSWYINPKSVLTIHNGVDHDKFTPTERVRFDGATVIVSGRLVDLKRVHIILNAFRIMGRTDIQLLVVGAGPEMGKLVRYTKDHNLTQVTFLGEQSDMNHWYGISDIFVQASETEGLSCSIMEAQACGLPCIVTDVGGNKEIVSDLQTGKLINANLDEEQMAATFANHIQALTDFPSERLNMSIQSTLRSRRLFSSMDMTKKYIDLYTTTFHYG